MSTFPQTRIRIAADIFKYTAFGDILRSDEDDYRPKFRAGDDIQFEIGLFNNGELLDISGIAAITLEIKPLDTELTERFDEDDDADNYDLRGPDLSLTPIRSKTLPASELNAALIKSAWDSNAPEQCHALISLSSAESNIAAGDRWLTIGIVTGDNPGRVRTVCAGPIRVLGGGLSQAASPDADTPETYYNTAESDARFLKLANNLSDLADVSVARDNLELGESDSPTFAGLTVGSDGVVDFNDNRLREVGDAAVGTDALNRRSADARYLQLAENGADLPDAAVFRTNLATYSRAEVDALAARSFGPALHLDGVTGAVTLPPAVGSAFAKNCTVALQLRLVDGRPPAGSYLYLFGCSDGANNTYQWRIDSTGAVVATLGDGTTAVAVTSTVVFADGPSTRWVWLALAIDAAAGTAQWYADGTASGAAADISGLDLSAGSYLAPAIGGRNVSGSMVSGPAMYFAQGVVYNRALSAAEVAARFGPQPTVPVAASSDRWGSPRALEINGDFELNNGIAPTNWYYVQYGASTVTLDADAHSGTASVKFTVDAANSIIELNQNSVFTVGQKYRVSLWAKGTVGATIDMNPGPTFPITSTEWTLYGTEFVATDAKFQLKRAIAASAIIWIDDIVVERIGAIASYAVSQDSRTGYQLRDFNANAHPGLLSATGCTWLEAGERGRLTLGGFTADAWLGGSERALIPAGYRIAEIIATETAGVAVNNLALGTTANGTDLVSSFSLLANETKSLTVAAPLAAKSAAKPVHLNDAPGGPWGGTSVSLTFILEKY